MASCAGLSYVELGDETYWRVSYSFRRNLVLGGAGADVTLNLLDGDPVPDDQPKYCALFDEEARKVFAGFAVLFRYRPERDKTVVFHVASFAWFLVAHAVEDYTQNQPQTLESHANNLLALAEVYDPGRDFNAVGLWAGTVGGNEAPFSCTNRNLLDALNELGGLFGVSILESIGLWGDLAELTEMSVSGGAVFQLYDVTLTTDPTPNTPFPTIELPLTDCSYQRKIQSPELTADWSNLITRQTVLGKNGSLHVGDRITTFERVKRHDIPPNSEQRHFPLDQMCAVVQQLVMQFQVKILSFTPATGPVATVVSVTGVYFTNITGVELNGTPVDALDITSDSALTFEVPAGATTGPITIVTSDAFSCDSILEFTVT